jgi:hypothetical protein
MNIEILAEEVHNTWADWMKYALSKCTASEDGGLIIPQEYVNRWIVQMNLSYEKLTEKEKESDRKIARKYLTLNENKDSSK